MQVLGPMVTEKWKIWYETRDVGDKLTTRLEPLSGFGELGWLYLDRFVLKYAGPEVYNLQLRLGLGHFYISYHSRNIIPVQWFKQA